jgi:hypothetical protein
LKEYSDIFVKEGELGRTEEIQHRIYKENVPPIFQRPYKMSPKEHEIIRKELDKMLAQGAIRPSRSPWASPVVLVRKKDGKIRFCVDFRKINQVTKKDKYPLPNIEEIMDLFGGSEWFSTMDLASGYWQVAIAQEDIEKTAFSTAFGLYEFVVMPFGLTNAPPTFQRLMNRILEEFLRKFVLVYIDDINVYSKTWDEHLQHLRKVFQKIKESGLKLKREKCYFGMTEVKFLGHVIGKEGIKPDPEIIEKIQNYPVPENQKKLRGFLGLASYYRKFIEGFAKIAQPLTKITGKNHEFKWTNEQQQAFEKLKERLMTYPVLRYPNFEKEFILMTDASKEGIGAVLAQEDQDRKEHPIAYFSKALTPCEKNYDTTNMEALAVIQAIKKFRHYLFGQKFKIITDHRALLWLLGTNKSTNSRIVRWRLYLQDFDFTIEHREGKRHLVADALSRSFPHPFKHQKFKP